MQLSGSQTNQMKSQNWPPLMHGQNPIRADGDWPHINETQVLQEQGDAWITNSVHFWKFHFNWQMVRNGSSSKWTSLLQKIDPWPILWLHRAISFNPYVNLSIDGSMSWLRRCACDPNRFRGSRCWSPRLSKVSNGFSACPRADHGDAPDGPLSSKHRKWFMSFTFWILVVMFKVLMVISQIPSQKFHGSRLPTSRLRSPGVLEGANLQTDGRPVLDDMSKNDLDLPQPPEGKLKVSGNSAMKASFKKAPGDWRFVFCLYPSLVRKPVLKRLNRHVRNKVNPNQHLQSRLVSWHLEIILTLHSSRPNPSNQPPTVETWSGERSAKLVSNCETRNPKPETDSEDLPSPGPIETRNPKPETRNPKPTLKTYIPSPGPIETRNPKPETDSDRRLNSPRTDRNPKPETRNRQRKLVSSDETRNPKPETRNPKPTAKVGFNRRNPKPETRNPKPETRNRLESDFWVALRIGTPTVVPS